MVVLVKLDTNHITDWEIFHAVFAEAFGFPEFYGRNVNAWIDCMTYLDDPEAGMTTVHAASGSVVTLQLEDVDSFSQRCPEQYEAIVECVAFVNWRRVNNTHKTEAPVLALSFYKTPPRSANNVAVRALGVPQ